MINKNFVKLIILKIKLKFSGKKAIVFGLYLGELQFLKNIIQKSYTELKNPIIIAHENEKTFEEFSLIFPDLTKKVKHIKIKHLEAHIFTDKEVNLYITSDGLGLDNIYSIYVFHGQPSKGLTFTHGKLDCFDALFLYGQLQEEALNYFIKTQLNNIKPAYLSLYKIGYTKSDELLNGKWKRDEVLKELNLPKDKVTVLYAPAFNENASLREFGLDIIKTLCSNIDFNVIAKLPVDCLRPQEDEYANGGINWFFELSELEKKFKNFKLFKDNQIDPALAASDVLVTCVSSVSFEFLALKKPVVFINTPLFYSNYLKKHIPGIDIKSWENLSFVNGGKKFGITVDQPKDLVKAIYVSLNDVDTNKKTKLVDYLLYNPGKATDIAIKQIQQILFENKKTTRSHKSFFYSKKIYKRISIKIKLLISRFIKKIINNLINKAGYSLVRNGLGYINAKEIVQMAKIKNLSVCDYLESLNTDKKKIGRRNRIISKMEGLGLFSNAKNICEIGAGTGMYLEKIIEKAPVQKYEIYETDNDWKKYLNIEYKNKINQLIIYNADGVSLGQTKSNTIDIVHAHAVFVYLPIIDIYNYLKECVRVCRNGGAIVFDVISDNEFNIKVAENWSNLHYKFAVITPDAFILDFIKKNNLVLLSSFNEIYAGSYSKYYILQKCLKK